MAEYYTVLKRAIAGIDPNIPDARRAVYDKARNALIGQLKAVDPPLTTAEISRQRLELEEAIRRAERESAAGVAAASAAPVAITPEPPRREPPPPPPARPAPPPQDDYPEPPPQSSAQDVFRRAIQEAGIRGSNNGAVERMPVSARAAPARHSATAPDLRRSEERPMEREPRRAPPPEARQRPPAAPPPEHYEPEPRLAPEYDQDWEEAPPPPPPRQERERERERAPAPHPQSGQAPQLDSRDRLAFTQKARGRGYLEEDDAELLEDERRPRKSRLPGIILSLLIIGVIGGLAALGWSQRAMLTDLLAQFESSEPPTLSEAPADIPPVAAAPESTKNNDRLLAGEKPAPDREVRRVGDEPGDAPEMAAMTNDGAAQPLPVSTNTGPIGDGQKAILYEEPLDNSAGGVTAINADVKWRFIESGPNGAEIEAILDVPERGMTIRFSLHKNEDDTLPASHLIEVTVDTPGDFPGDGVNEVPRLVLKPNEESQGQSLVGAAAKVADGFFWIALSANSNDIASNLALLRGRNWIDLPFVYGNGQRAILTFEKGTLGAQVFEEAISAWGTG